MLRVALAFMTIVLDIPMIIVKVALGILSLILLMAIKGLTWCEYSIAEMLDLRTAQEEVKDGYNAALDIIGSFKFKSSRKETET